MQATKGRGRPPKDKTGKHIWIPSYAMDVVLAVLSAMKPTQTTNA